MPRNITQKIKERKEAILKLLADGCKTTAYILKALGLTHTEAFYVLEMLKNEGYVIKTVFGKTAVWCPNNEEYNRTIGELLQEIRRIVETHNLKYVYPMRLYRLVLKDRKAYELMSKFVPMSYSNTVALAFLNRLLKMLYGEPYFEGEKIVYITIRNTRPQKTAA
jgi:hypothetical protein